ncbi:MAG: hypothetical protein J6A04_00920 [Clostridia bacterium]|nr:hypothetical protein [Clostridia bacterium]
MICDQLAAGKVYQGKNWTKEYQLSYWNRTQDTFPLNENLKPFVTQMLTIIAQEGINKGLTKKNLKECYNKCIAEKNV